MRMITQGATSPVSPGHGIVICLRPQSVAPVPVIRRAYHHTKIIFTLGPATANPEMLAQLIRQGTDVCRLNMAHASHDWTREAIRMVRAACEKEGRQIAIMMDVKGPEIRTGSVPEPIALVAGETLELWISPPPGLPVPGIHRVTVDHSGLTQDLKAGDTVLVDSGLIRLEVTATSALSVATRVVIGGELGSRRHINLPGVDVRLPSLTEKDLADIKVGIEEGVDLYALSFVRHAAAIEELRTLLKESGSTARIVAKLEDQTGVRNLIEIVRATDCLMVARGDLGIEIPYEQLPLVQDTAVKACLAEGKPVIIATTSWNRWWKTPSPPAPKSPTSPTRCGSERTRVMLSGETTTGKYPLECVSVMKRIIEATEPLNTSGLQPHGQIDHTEGQTGAFRRRSGPGDGGMPPFSSTPEPGTPHSLAAALRPTGIPVYAFTDRMPAFRQMLMLWGIEPFSSSSIQTILKTP